MFVVNFKLDYKKILIACVVIALFIATIIEFGNKNNIINVNSDIANYDFDLNDENYTEMLKNIHDNLDTCVGKTVHMSGFIFRMPDFKENYIVCGKNTIANNEDKVAGILCEYENAKELLDNEWIEITGVIIKGEYNGEKPVLKIGKITKITAPSNTFVTNINEVNRESTTQNINSSNS